MNNKFWCHCGDCKHDWVLFECPIDVTDAVKNMRNVTCPKCHSGKVLIGKAKKENEK